MNATTTETIEILYREQFSDGLVAYTIQVGMYHKEECVRIRDGQGIGCTCKKQTFNQCLHQEALAKIEVEYQSH